jgi:hypothetical protein
VDSAPAPSRPITRPNNTAVSTRLAAIEDRLDDVIRRLDELNTNLLTLVKQVPPSRRHTADD